VSFIRDGPSRVIIDPGMVPHPDDIIKPLQKLGESPEAITDVVLSHHHPDHTINTALFANARIHDFWGTYRGDEWVQRSAEGQSVSRSILLIETPGHSPQDITTLVGTTEGIVAFSHLWVYENGRDPVGTVGADAAALMKNRQRVLKVASFIVPGHGNIFRPNRA
jgi:glyoxylase-like metal-dependent hydrolase (beta-lactamase superfamily II)